MTPFKLWLMVNGSFRGEVIHTQYYYFVCKKVSLWVV